MSSRPNPLVSFAQNGEDIVLSRALKPWDRKGFWVDCGAGHPKYDSVTKLFSQFGWTGINIEPLDDEFMLLTQDRPLDENIQCLLGEHEGIGSIYAGPAENRGSSTTDPALVERYAKEFGQTFSKSQVPIRRLDEILRLKSRPTIDFLKIDVEGAELDLLRGIDLSEFNPRIIVIEATRPNSTELVHESWEDRVLNGGYVCALFDGLNRFYVKRNDAELTAMLLAPANTLDNYKTNIELGLKQVADSAQEIINNHLEQFETAEKYAQSLQDENTKLQIALANSELVNANQQQKVIDAEEQNVIFIKANEALEKQLIKLHDVERQLTVIRSYKLFRLLAKAKRILRKMTGRK